MYDLSIKYIDGITLHDIIHSNNKELKSRALYALFKLKDDIRILHNYNIAHNDLNDRNLIYVNKEDKFIIIDYQTVQFDGFNKEYDIQDIDENITNVLKSIDK